MNDYLRVSVDLELKIVQLNWIMEGIEEHLQEMGIRLLLKDILNLVETSENYKATVTVLGDEIFPINMGKNCISVRTTLVFKNNIYLNRFLDVIKQM